MNPLAAIVAPLLLLPVPAPTDAVQMSGNAAGRIEPAPALDGMPILSIAEKSRDVVRQVSIEQRIIIRVTPQSPGPQRTGIVADLPRKAIAPKLEERSMGKCVPVAGIAGVQIAADNKLMLFMRDTRVVRAGLDKGCTAQDFYSGFYVARTSDGQMCSGRDKLQSRNGANCKLGKLKQLVPAGN